MQQITQKELWSESWFPVKINDGQVHWKMIEDKRFTEPFYEDTIRCVAAREKEYIQTPLDIFDRWPAEQGDYLQPSAFIFHVSRCGSTLLAQMLSAIPENIVLSEAPVIDQLLRSNLPEKKKNQQLKNLVAWLCRKRFSQEQYAFLKMDAWHLLRLNRFREVFPHVPFMVL